MTYVPPNHDGAIVRFRARYENFIGGDWVKPVKREYFEDVTPVTGRAFCEAARGSSADIETALDAAHGAKVAWGRTSPGDRANVLSKIADRIEQDLEKLAVAESWENGKLVREPLDCICRLRSIIFAISRAAFVRRRAPCASSIATRSRINSTSRWASSEAGKPLASNHRIAKVAFTGKSETGRLILQYASENLIRGTLS